MRKNSSNTLPLSGGEQVLRLPCFVGANFAATVLRLLRLRVNLPYFLLLPDFLAQNTPFYCQSLFCFPFVK
jgi:hypothetical protein